MTELLVLADPHEMAEAAADLFVEASADSIEARGQFTVALSGGTTPRGTYERLAAPDLATRVSWRNVHLFWGDERSVPPDHPDSNYRLVRESLLQKVPIPQTNTHRIQGELDPDLAAEAYQEVLKTVFGSAETPRLDLIFLGLGEDGHTASLFPGTRAVRETRQWVVAQYVEPLKAWRITLTPPVLNASRRLVFLVAGESKADRLREVLQGEPRPDVLPAQIVQPRKGQTTWIVDQAAAAQL